MKKINQLAKYVKEMKEIKKEYEKKENEHTEYLTCIIENTIKNTEAYLLQLVYENICNL